TGWYEDINCHEKWDGISPSNGEDILELYAGWGKEPEEYTEGLVFRLMEDKEEYEVVGYEGADTNVIIPSLYMNLPVSKIGEKAFSFPASTHVVSILLPDSIKEIHKNSFIGTNLTGELFIPKSMYYFGHIEGVKNCQVRVKSNHDYHKEMMVNNVLTIVSKDEKELIYVNNTKEVNATFEVPNSITKIGDFSMYRSNFKEIVLPNTITVVGEKAFMYSKAVVNIPTGIKEIHANAYVRCILNENLILPEGLEVIGNGAFGENNLISVVFPSTLMTLGNGVFYSQTTVDGAYNLVKHIEFKSFQLDTTSTTAFDFAFLWLNYKDTSIKEITVKLPSDETQAQKLKNSLLQQIESDNVIRYLGNDFVINFE
ncbi:MAG TPA: leucine-rich repeat protein, partial [Bacilli bacterium]|nr:leucine-rich repeat protein [Bacilli bacterium]